MADSERQRETTEELRKDLKKRGVRLLKCPSVLGFSGIPGNYEISLRYDSGTTHVTVGAVIVCVDEMNRENFCQGGIFSGNSLLTRILRHRIKQSGGYSIDEDRFFRALSFEENSGIFVTFLAGDASVEKRWSRGVVLAAQVLMYLSRDSLLPRANAAEVESSLCRGCEECSVLCPVIEMRQGTNGAPVAFIDPTLCLGCGACVSCCPTGAIMQDVRGDEEVVSMLRSLLSTDHLPGEGTWENL